MKNLIAIILLAVSPAFADNVTDAIANATGDKSSPAAIAGAPNWSIRTDTYNGPKGSGCQVVATVTSGSSRASLTSNHGPETYRQHMPDLAAFKTEIITAIDRQFWNVDLKRGITVGGITLAAYESDRNAFTQIMVMLDSAEINMSAEQKEAFRQTTQTIADIHGATHTLTVSQLRQLLLGYGAAYQALWTDCVSRQESIRAAQSFDEL